MSMLLPSFGNSVGMCLSFWPVTLQHNGSKDELN